MLKVFNYSCYCSVQFQVERSDRSHGDDEEGGRTTATGDGQEYTGIGERAHAEESYEEIVSPTSFVPLVLFFKSC